MSEYVSSETDESKEQCSESKPKNRSADDYQVPPGLVASVLREQYHVLVMCDNNEILVYDKGLYKRNGKRVIQTAAKHLMGMGFTTHMWREILHHIISGECLEREELDGDTEIINVTNGMLNIKTRQLSPHSPKHLSTIRIPVHYDPEAGCPNITKFLSEVLLPEDIPVIQEAIGYTLYRALPFQVWFLLAGEGANGKSTFLRLLNTFIGQDNCVAIRIQTLMEKQFARAELYRKMLNVSADLPARGFSDTSTINELTGGDRIYAEKKFHDPFYFTSFAKQWFSANILPKIPAYGDTMAFWRRLILIDFPNTFIGNSCDPYLDAKLQTPEELSGLLNFALDGLDRLLENNRFSYHRTWQQVQKEYTMRSDSVGAFTEQCCQFDHDSWTQTADLRSRYFMFCQEQGMAAVNDVHFSRELNKYCKTHDHWIKQEKRFITDGTKTGYRGIGLV